jgi:UDP-N-acetylmuramate dehydrogenase
MRDPVDWTRLADRLTPGSVIPCAPLRTLTTLRIGGPAGLVGRVQNVAQAQEFQAFAAAHGLACDRLGGGSNILADDAGFPGLLLKVETSGFVCRGDAVRAGAGWSFDDLIATTLREGLVGLEFASGIPGTLGGAVVGNAGCYGQEIGDFVAEATVLRPDGRVVTMGPEGFAFTYRDSALKATRAVVLEVVLQLRRGDAGAAGARREELIADRRRKHPCGQPTAGSWFKNLPPAEPGGRRRPAGALLEAVGAKEMREGGAAVFDRHANIIVNAGNATSADVLRLADRMRAAVRERFQVDLEREVRHLGPGDATSAPGGAD